MQVYECYRQVTNPLQRHNVNYTTIPTYNRNIRLTHLQRIITIHFPVKTRPQKANLQS